MEENFQGIIPSEMKRNIFLTVDANQEMETDQLIGLFDLKEKKQSLDSLPTQSSTMKIDKIWTQEQSQQQNTDQFTPLQQKNLEYPTQRIMIILQKFREINEQEGHQNYEKTQDKVRRSIELKIEMERQMAKLKGSAAHPTFLNWKWGGEVDYLTVFIQRLLECFKGQRLSEEENAIVKEAIEKRMLCVTRKILFLSEQNYIFLIELLRNCRSVNKWVIYGKGNIDEIKNKCCFKLFSCLPFNPEVSLNIYDKLMKDPLSNFVASSEDLTLKQKITFYENLMPDLQQYAVVLYDSESIETQIIKEQEMIIEQICKDVRKVPDLIDKVLNFEYDKILDDYRIAGFKERLYFFIRTRCPNYYREFFRRRFQLKETMSQNDLIKIRFELRKKFIEIKLSPENWEEVEEELILKRNSSIIDNLRLSCGGKCQLWLFIINRLKDYFFYSENQLDSPSKIKCLTLDVLMMKNEVQEEKKSFSMLLKESQDLSRKMIADKSIKSMVVKKQIEEKSLETVKELCKLIRESGVDQQKRHQTLKTLKTTIFTVLLKQEKYVSSSSVEAFAGKYENNGNKLPSLSIQEVINLKPSEEQQLEKESLPFVVDQSIVMEQVGPAQKSFEDQLKECFDSPIKKEQASKVKGSSVGESMVLLKAINVCAQIEEFRKEYLGLGGTTLEVIFKTMNKLSDDQRQKKSKEILQAILEGKLQEKKDLFKGPQFKNLSNEIKKPQVLSLLDKYSI